MEESLLKCMKTVVFKTMPLLLEAKLDYLFVEARRRLGLLGKEGFDIFGKNELFAPRIKWEALKKIVEGMREIAQTYEDSYNSLSETIEAAESCEQV